MKIGCVYDTSRICDDADMVRRVDAKAYERLAKEENEFAKDAALLRAAIRSKPATFQRTVEARIQQGLAASHEVSLAGQAPVVTRYADRGRRAYLISLRECQY